MSEVESCQVDLKPHLAEAIARIAKENDLNEPETDVKSATAKGDNFMGFLYRVKVKGTTKEGHKKQLNLILKAINVSQTGDPRATSMTVYAYTKESVTYSELFPTLRRLEEEAGLNESDCFVCPKYYGSSLEPFKEWIALHDLDQDGFKIVEKYEPIDYDRALLMVKTLAKFHALIFVLKQKDKNKFDEFASRMLWINEAETFADYTKVTTGLATDLVKHDGKLKEKMDELSKKALEIFSLTDDPRNLTPYNVICHADCWNNNFIFKYKDGKPVDVQLLDWQTLKASSPALDVAILISLSTGKEFRKKHFTDIIEKYYVYLDEAIRRFGYNTDLIYPKAIYDEHLKLLFPLALLTAINSFPFTLSSRDDVPEMESLVEDHSAALLTIKYSKYAQNRIKDLIEDYVNYGFI